MHVLLFSKQHPADDDESVSKTGHHGNDPDGDAKEGDVEQVPNGRDAVADRLTDLDHRGVSTHVERRKLAAYTNVHRVEMTRRKIAVTPAYKSTFP